MKRIIQAVRSVTGRDRPPSKMVGWLSLVLAPAIAVVPAAGLWSGAARAEQPNQPRVEQSSPAGAPAAALAVQRVAPAETLDLPGFSASASARQRELEQIFLAVPSSTGAAATARWLTAEPHMAGTPAQSERVDSLAAWLRRLGFQVEIEEYRAYLPHPDTIALRLLTPEPVTFELREGDVDPLYAWTWNAFSANGAARGPVVYANYGRAEDFEALERLGVEVRNAIVLIRYGGIYRGAKVWQAERRGAAGVVLYSDPADGGFVAGDTVPFGPHRPSRAVQRGTVARMWRYTGDPLTPGWPALPGVPRLDPDSATDLPGIPVLNISGAQGRQLLQVLGGPAAPAGFEGGWDLPYQLGAGGAELEMLVRQDFRLRPVRNVVARLPGREPQAVVLGVHIDAWVRGGVDAQSGTGVILEIARGLGALHDTGWRPRREIVLGFWGGEEFGVVGSTEFVEARRQWLVDHAVAYFNIDVFTAGTLDISGSPSLRDLVWRAARDVEDPVEGGSLADHWLARWQPQAPADEAVPADARPPLRPLGLGSDWTAFFHHAGVPSLQWTMNGRGSYSVYHSALDDFGYLETWADSGFAYTPRMAAVMGLAALRLAESDALPLDYGRYADRIVHWVDSLAASMPRAGAAVTEAEMGRIRSAAAELGATARAVIGRRNRAMAAGDEAYLRRLNRVLPRVEGALLRPEAEGSWYRHLVFGPDAATGYGSVLLPALQPAAMIDPYGAGPGSRVTYDVRELEQALESASALLQGLVR